MHESNDRPREPLIKFLRRYRDQILTEWQTYYFLNADSSPGPDNPEPYPHNLPGSDSMANCQPLVDVISSYLSLCIEQLEKDDEQKDSAVKLRYWIDKIKDLGIKLPDVVESILNLKKIVSGFMMDRLYCRPMEVKYLNQAINTIFDQALIQLCIAYSSENGKKQISLPLSRETDMTDKKKELLVLSTIAHELHSPLTSIIGYAENLIENLDDRSDNRSMEVREDVEKVLRNAYYLMDIIRNSMEWSKLEVREASLKPESFDLRECALEVLTAISSMLTEKGIRAVVRSPKDIPKPFGDYSRTRQVLLNLLTNAIKYTPSQGKIAIEIAPYSDKEGNGNGTKPGFIKVTVIDNGIGIDREKFPFVFEEFSRVDRNANEGKEGIGLGLFIARRLVELQGGRIWLKSQPKKGSRFSFTLPTVHSQVGYTDQHHPNNETVNTIHSH